MNKATKGALAAAAAGSLLLGGAGSLAYWTATGDVNGGSFASGTLSLTDGTCDPDWVYNTGAASEGDVVTLIVPGDELTKQCTMTLDATGDNLSATVDAPNTVTYTPVSGAPGLDLTVATTYQIGTGVPADPALGGAVTSADDGKTITVTYVVTVPYGTAENATTPVNVNNTQGITSTLDTLTVKLTQDDPNN
ncbi:alternate signal-mediated exported protein [Nocardioides ginsengisegetis]|uniref:Alternate signal-mediated exported protein n=1 Tax=Nocardioides ginsengisegetis TaxID=661491 RepID=A0A7W3P8V4_9ACTN|nr:alternate-type signal peptide domain-containing protein [Nocardioides ginsengisegetis]MBA8803040.1 alternate signal-mediated exported protein [Nocardioides ginsengisegetis]